MAYLLVLFALLAGVSLPVQAGVNAALARGVGRPEWAGVVSFAVGLVGIAAYALVSRARVPTTAELAGIPGWAWTGGLIGAFYVTSVILLTPRLGLALTMGFAVAGQLVGALVLDQIGAFGLDARPVTLSRAVGVVLLVVSVLLIRR
ncbi:MAG: DMT family transporter [Anaeromyxobacter sp.]